MSSYNLSVGSETKCFLPPPKLEDVAAAPGLVCCLMEVLVSPGFVGMRSNQSTRDQGVTDRKEGRRKDCCSSEKGAGARHVRSYNMFEKFG